MCEVYTLDGTDGLQQIWRGFAVIVPSYQCVLALKLFGCKENIPLSGNEKCAVVGPI